jgi:hypothetical protein
LGPAVVRRGGAFGARPKKGDPIRLVRHPSVVFLSMPGDRPSRRGHGKAAVKRFNLLVLGRSHQAPQ